MKTTPMISKTLIKELEKKKKRIATLRDSLRNELSELESLAEDIKEAEESISNSIDFLDQGIEYLSRQV